MNQRQKLIQTQFLNNEEGILNQLRESYGQSQKDINSKISKLQFSIGELQAEYDWLDDTDPEKVKIKSMIQSKIYQKQYQESLKGQVDKILDNLQNNAYKGISEYLDKSYEDGFIGTMFDLQGQGIPLCMPIDQEAMVRAVQLDSKISKGLYTRMGEDVSKLKRQITSEVSRGIASGMSYEQVAQQISFKMTGTKYNDGGALARALTIARTEGHRIEVQAGMDACERAKEKGADVVKQWDSTMDKKTRKSHTKVDGEIRELEEAFSNGLMFPGDPEGGAAEVVNCRCALLQRARWALDEGELEVLKNRASFFGLDKAETFEDYKKKYLKAANDKTDYFWGNAETETEKAVLKEIQGYYDEVSEKYGIKMDILGDKLADSQADWDMALKMNTTEYMKEHPKVSRKQAESIVKRTRMAARPTKDDISVLEGGQYWHDASRIVEKNGEYSFERIKKIIVNQNASDFSLTVKEAEASIAEQFAKIERRKARGRGRLYLSNSTNGGAGTFLHEYGHAIDFTKGIAENPKFLEWYNTLSEDDICLGLSSYAATNANEFIAEAFAESFYSYQRPMSKKFMKILDDILFGG